MKKILLGAALVLFTASVSVSDAMAQGRRGGRGNERVENRSGNRPGRNHNGSGNIRPGKEQGNRPGLGQSVRPGSGNNHDRPSMGQGNRPGNGNNHDRPSMGQGNRPGSGNNHDRPSMGQGNRPGHGNNHDRPSMGQGNRPGHGNNYDRPGHGNGFRPGQANGWHPGRPQTPPPPALRPGASRPPIMHRPHRPGLAPVRPFYRPVPPPSWRPARRYSLMSNILGISLGISINTAIDRLLYSGYTIDGYGSNEIYLSNVPQFDYYWPEAVMYYGPNGFVGSRFYYSTIGYDMSRYRSVYNMLCSRFGAPISVNGPAVTWYGTGNQYISLDFTSTFTGDGQRFFTTLSLGM